MSRSDSGIKDWEEVEFRTRALVRSERTWAKSGSVYGGSSSNLNSVVGATSSGLSAGGEERERRIFCEALRDGFVLCQLMNKLRSASIVRPDVREDGIVRTSNVTKFLAACSSYGLLEEDLFQRDDLIEATGESLARVARTIITLLKFVEAPTVGRSKFIYGQGQRQDVIPSLYTQSGTVSRATASTPNLAQTPLSASPTPPSPVRQRYSPPSGLPTVRSVSTDSIDMEDEDEEDENVFEVKAYPIPPLVAPPPKSPFRSRSTKPVDDGRLLPLSINAASPRRYTDAARPLVGDTSVADSVADTYIRHSVASTTVTETTMTTDVSSILDFSRSRSTSNGHNKFGTIRTITTDATSEAPSLTRTEGSAIADELSRRRSMDKHHKESRISDGPIPDLSRVVEEADESASSARSGVKDEGKGKAAEQEKVVNKPRPAINLRKGKWPDDFIDAFPAHSPTRVITPKPPSPDQQDSSYNSIPVSVSPPRKVAIVGRNENPENLAQFPRRPTHPTRHSLDAPALMPKEAALGRDGSPDGIPAASGRIIPRRHSTKPGLSSRSGVHFPLGGEAQGTDSDLFVPFPQTATGEPGTSRLSGTPDPDDKPRVPRGRFRSDIESAARRRVHLSPNDESGPGARRSRIESMVNLGVASNNASASDLLSRDSRDSSVLPKALILREDGKPPTHFQLGNCIGRGQFGSVYRALNLNTGQMVAVKRIRLEGLKEEEVTTLMREVDLVKSLSHPSIVKYEGMARDEDTLSIVLEYAENGSLGQTLKAFGKLNERLVASYVVKILEGLHYLHQSDVVHCDLKAANILTTKNGNVKLSDFGVSLNLRAVEREIKDVAGTPNWMAPEVIELKGASTKSDIWSLACTIIELLTGRPPYAEIANSMSVMFRIVEDDKPPIPEGCSQLLRDFLTKCFNKDPTKRPSAELLCEHPWLKKNWGIHRELRPQDSIPFLRRVSADLQKSEVARYLSQIEMPEPSSPEALARVDDISSSSPTAPRASNASVHPMADNDIAPREHSFVKTTFSKPMICRVCLLNVKKSAVLCAQCSLIAHAKCAVNAPPTCDLRAQLLLYAKYAEKGNPASVYSNPADGLRDLPSSPASDVPFVAHSRTSIDAPSPSPLTPTPPVHPPIAYKFLGALKRSSSKLFHEPTQPLRESREEKRLRKKPAVTLNTYSNERPHSLTSNSTSLQSATTAAESLSSRHDRRSFISSEQGTRKSGSGLSAPGNSEAIESSKIVSPSGVSDAVNDHDDTRYDGLPGSLLMEPRRTRKRESKSSGNCIVQ